MFSLRAGCELVRLRCFFSCLSKKSSLSNESRQHLQLVHNPAEPPRPHGSTWKHREKLVKLK